MSETKNAKSVNSFSSFAWGLSLLAALLAFAAWGQSMRWNFSNLSNYRLFPLFGLLAFSLMWSMYVVGFVRKQSKHQPPKMVNYYKYLPLAIFAAILLHPSLLVWQLWRDGFGLPPGSYLNNYVAQSAKWAVVISTTAFAIFIIYEFRYKYRVKQWWKYMELLADLALVGLYFHALKLGSNFQHGWYRYVWFFYGLTLAFLLADLYLGKYKDRKTRTV